MTPTRHRRGASVNSISTGKPSVTNTTRSTQLTSINVAVDIPHHKHTQVFWLIMIYWLHRFVMLLVAVTQIQSLFLRPSNHRAFILQSQAPPALIRAAASTKLFSTTRSSSLSGDTTSGSPSSSSLQLLSLLTIEKEDLEHHVVSWGYPKYRAGQVWTWIRQGMTDPDGMTNIPKALRADLQKYAKRGTLTLHTELISKDGTRKRAYQLHDGQLIESVLMPYEKNGRYTACISSQAGCAMGCVFCATGQMGFVRQLTADEIFEQVAQFDAELALQQDNDDEEDGINSTENVVQKRKKKRVSNVVFMGMGEPLANYRNVRHAVNRMTSDLGIGAPRITISTVGVIPNIRKLMIDPDMPPVRLAVSLHCATDESRTQLLPANARYGGLDELMLTLKEYVSTVKKRVTLEWALIEFENDDVATARQLGNLIKRFDIRHDMIHVNVIPLNPTGGYGGSPSGRNRVNEFCSILINEFNIACTPRMRRGIDINAGCGQLTAELNKQKKTTGNTGIVELVANHGVVHADEFAKNQLELADFMKLPSQQPFQTNIGVYDDHNDDGTDDNHKEPEPKADVVPLRRTALNDVDTPSTDYQRVDFFVAHDAVDFESDDYEDPEFTTDWEIQEAERLISMVQGTIIPLASIGGTIANANAGGLLTNPSAATTTTTSITDEDSILNAKRRRKKLIKNLKAVDRLRERHAELDFEFNDEQLVKLRHETEWRMELESIEHNLK